MKDEILIVDKSFYHKDNCVYNNCRYCKDGIKDYWLFGDTFNLKKAYIKNKKLHREDGPAVEWNDGYKVWFQHGKRHRLDGPAFISANGYKSWFEHGRRLPIYTDEEFKIYKKFKAFI